MSAPWAVSVMRQSGGGWVFRCSGVLISPVRVVTAAHCVYTESDRFDPGVLVVVAGSSRAAVGAVCAGCQPQLRRVASVGVAPGYQPYATARFALGPTFPPDVAVLRLRRPFDTTSPVVRPVAIALSDRMVAGERVVVAGLGAEKASGVGTGVLRKIQAQLLLPLVAACPSIGAVCTLSATGSTCYGDSGAGVILPGARPLLVAIIDRVGCAPDVADISTGLTQPQIRSFVELSSTTGAPPLPPGTRWQPYRWLSYVIECSQQPLHSFAFAIPDNWQHIGQRGLTEFGDPPDGPFVEVACDLPRISETSLFALVKADSPSSARVAVSFSTINVDGTTMQLRLTESPRKHPTTFTHTYTIYDPHDRYGFSVDFLTHGTLTTSLATIERSVRSIEPEHD